MGIGQRFERGEITALREGLRMSPAKFAETIRNSIQARGIKPNEPVYRAMSKMSEVAVRRWENGENSPSVHVLEAISRTFGVDASRFFVDCD